MWGTLNSDWENVGREGHTGVDGLGGGKQAGARREVVPSQNLKLNCQALDLVNQMWAGLFSGRRDPIGVEYTGFEVMGASDWASQLESKSKTEPPGLSFGQPNMAVFIFRQRKP